MTATATSILLLGDPRLRLSSERVTDFTCANLHKSLELLKNTLHAFRESNGFGRAMAAPQLGILQRIIVLHWNGTTSFLINPEFLWQSTETRTLWDDCMSIPGLMIKVARHESVSIAFQDETGAHHKWSDLPFDLAELLQHEMDHLDGILATDRAVDKESLVAREQFLSTPEYYFRQVDHIIASYRPALTNLN